MTLDELRTQAAELFPIAVRNAVEHPSDENSELIRLNQLCWEHYKPLGFSCMSACFSAAMPKSEGMLDLTSWSSSEMKVLPWIFRVNYRPLHFGQHLAHFEIRHDGPLPGVTETGYRSIFAPMTTFADRTPEDFIRHEVCKDLPKSSQMTLF
jgi:hypothetical protein